MNNNTLNIIENSNNILKLCNNSSFRSNYSSYLKSNKLENDFSSSFTISLKNLKTKKKIFDKDNQINYNNSDNFIDISSFESDTSKISYYSNKLSFKNRNTIDIKYNCVYYNNYKFKDFDIPIYENNNTNNNKKNQINSIYESDLSSSDSDLQVITKLTFDNDSLIEADIKTNNINKNETKIKSSMKLNSQRSNLSNKSNYLNNLLTSSNVNFIQSNKKNCNKFNSNIEYKEQLLYSYNSDVLSDFSSLDKAKKSFINSKLIPTKNTNFYNLKYNNLYSLDKIFNNFNKFKTENIKIQSLDNLLNNNVNYKNNILKKEKYELIYNEIFNYNMINKLIIVKGSNLSGKTLFLQVYLIIYIINNIESLVLNDKKILINNYNDSFNYSNISKLSKHLNLEFIDEKKFDNIIIIIDFYCAHEISTCLLNLISYNKLDRFELIIIDNNFTNSDITNFNFNSIILANKIKILLSCFTYNLNFKRKGKDVDNLKEFELLKILHNLNISSYNDEEEFKYNNINELSNNNYCSCESKDLNISDNSFVSNNSKTSIAKNKIFDLENSLEIDISDKSSLSYSYTKINNNTKKCTKNNIITYPYNYLENNLIYNSLVINLYNYDVQLQKYNMFYQKNFNYEVLLNNNINYYFKS